MWLNEISLLIGVDFLLPATSYILCGTRSKSTCVQNPTSQVRDRLPIEG